MNGRYSPIVQGLREAEDPTALARAVASSPWGTGPGVLKVLGASGAAQPLVRGATTAPASPAATVPNPGLDPSKLSALQNIHDLLGLPMPAGLAQALGQNGQTQQPKMAMPSTGNKAVDAVQSAKEYIGTPYSWGGGGPGGPSKGIGRGASTKGFDCSALLQYAWAKQGVHIPRTTYEQYKTGVPVAQQNLQPGDAIFFRGSDAKDGLPGHVGMYLGNGKFIEAPHTGATVRISDLSSRSDYVGARRYG